MDGLAIMMLLGLCSFAGLFVMCFISAGVGDDGDGDSKG
jgi:hypothetical protein